MQSIHSKEFLADSQLAHHNGDVTDVTSPDVIIYRDGTDPFKVISITIIQWFSNRECVTFCFQICI